MNDQQQLEYIKTEFDKNLKDGLLNLHVDWLIKQVEMLQNAKPLIAWQKYDPENPPEFDQPYIVYSDESKYLTFGELVLVSGRNRWVEASNSSALVPEDITHYAPINLPGEETTE